MDSPAKKFKPAEDGTSDDKNAQNTVPIRKLIVGSVESDMNFDHIKAYFEQFGEVETVEAANDDTPSDTHNYFVQFKMADAAQSLLDTNQETHTIGNCDVTVKAAKPWNQPDHIFNLLNNDCLRIVFQNLNFIDLLRAADVCVCFNQLARETFTNKYKHLDLSDAPELLDPRDHMYNENDLENLLCKYGSLIESLTVDSNKLCKFMENSLMSMIKKYCCLKALHLVNFDMRDLPFDEIKSVLANLTKLQLSFSFGDVSNILGACIGLKSLRLENCRLRFTNQPNLKWKLEEAHFIANTGFLYPHLCTFINQQSTLTKLSVSYNGVLFSGGIHMIADNLQDIQELEFNEDILESNEVFEESVVNLSHLKSLKVLKLNFQRHSIGPLMNALATSNTPIEHLKVINGLIDIESVESIAQLKQMKVCEFSCTDGLIDAHIVELTEGLPQLRELHLDRIGASVTISGLKSMLSEAKQLSLIAVASCHIKIELDDYHSMLNTVKNRPTKVKLVVKIRNIESNVNVPNTILQQNRAWFYVDEQIEDEQTEMNPSINDSDDDFDFSDDEPSSSEFLYDESSQSDSDADPNDELVLNVDNVKPIKCKRNEN